jgi:hypothetical protein
MWKRDLAAQPLFIPSPWVGLAMRFSYWPPAQYPNRLAAAGDCATDQFSR